MHKVLLGAAMGFAMAIANVSPASAAPPPAPMLEGAYALAPFSFVKFCIDYPAECPRQAGASRIRLTGARMSELTSVNRAVNASIVATPDTSALRYWRLNVAAGDCNNFAIQKRHELIARGWPAAALALTVVKTAWGEGHLVVTVRTDQGDLVLDNLRAGIVSWQRAGYDWIMRQSEGNPQYWVELEGGRAGALYAAQTLDAGPKVAEADDVSGALAARVSAAAIAAPVKPVAVAVALAPVLAPTLAKAPKLAEATDAVAVEARARDALKSTPTNPVALAESALAELKRAVAGRAVIGWGFDAATTKGAIEAAEARLANAALADLANWAEDDRQAVAPLYAGAIEALEPFFGPRTARRSGALDLPAKLQATLGEAIDPMEFGFI